MTWEWLCTSNSSSYFLWINNQIYYHAVFAFCTFEMKRWGWLSLQSMCVCVLNWLPHRGIERLMDRLRSDTERREVEGWEGRGRPQKPRDSLSVRGIGNICSGLTAGLPPAASCTQLHTTKIRAGPQMVFQPTVRVMIHLPSFMEERWWPIFAVAKVSDDVI